VSAAPAAPAGGRRERAKERNRAAILDAGRAVFAERGYGEASVRDIIGRTGLASGTFYNYSPDKESVLRALVEESALALRAAVREARRRSGSVEGFVGDAYRAFFGLIVADPAMFALMRRNAGTIRAMLGEPVLGAGVQELLEDLREAIAAGGLPPFDAEYMAAAMAGVGFEVGALMVGREPVDPEGAAAFASELFVGGIERLGR
jgi:AcrR family transcriptional regulator